MNLMKVIETHDHAGYEKINAEPSQENLRKVVFTFVKGAGPSPETRRGPHFKNTLLDVCCNQGAKRERGAQISNGAGGHHWPYR